MPSVAGGSDSKASAYSAKDPGSTSRSGRSPGEGSGTPLQCLAWKIPWTEEPGRLQSMRLSDFQLSFRNQDAPALDCPGALSMEPGLSAVQNVSSRRLAERAEWGKELWFSGLDQGKQAGCHLEC